MNNIYRFAGMSITAVTDEKPVPCERFSAFLSDRAEKDNVTVRVIRGRLPEKPGKVTVIDDRRTFTDDGVARLYCSYFSVAEKKPVDYACREGAGNEFTLYTDFDRPLSETAFFDALNVPELLAKRGLIILHSSFVLYQGAAVIFAGNKQVGKTTQGRLWEKYAGAKTVNGDRSALRTENGILTAYGVPFCGSSGRSENISAPVRAVVFPAIAETTRLIRNDSKDVFRRVLPLMTYDRKCEAETALAADIAAHIAERIPVYSLPCTPDEGAVTILKKELFPE